MRQRRYDGKIEGWPRDGYALCHRATDGTLSSATDDLTIEAGFCRLYNVTSAQIDDIFTASDVTNPDDVIANNISVSALNPQLSGGSRCELTWWWGRLQMAAQHFMGIARCECLACASSRPYGATQATGRCCNNLLFPHLLFPKHRVCAHRQPMLRYSTAGLVTRSLAMIRGRTSNQVSQHDEYCDYGIYHGRTTYELDVVTYRTQR